MSAKRRTVWISGASSGIGMAVARACHHRGDRLILSARRSEVLDALRDELGAEDALIVPFDLTNTGASPSKSIRRGTTSAVWTS